MFWRGGRVKGGNGKLRLTGGCHEPLFEGEVEGDGAGVGDGYDPHMSDEIEFDRKRSIGGGCPPR